MNNKRGQVTIFIILAILIISAVALFFTLRGTLQSDQGYSPEVAPVANFVQECLEDTTREGIYDIALNGGYYEIPEQNKLSIYGQNYVYYYNGGFIYPELEIIENSLSEYVSVNLESCFNFSFFNNQGFKISYSDYSIFTTILDSEVKVEMESLFVIKKEEGSFQINEFSTSFQSDFLNLIKVSEELVINYSANPDFICLSCVSDISEKNDVSVSSEVFLIPGFEDQIIFFSIDSSEEVFEDRILNLVFVVRK